MTLEVFEGIGHRVLSAAICGQDWVEELEPLSEIVGALGCGPIRACPPQLFALPTRGVRSLLAEFRAGRHPHMTSTYAVRNMPNEGFIADYMSPRHAIRRKHPFYNEFLRPRRVCHEASAFLDRHIGGDVRMLFFRTDRAGPFDTDVLGALSRTLPYLRAAAMLSRAALQTMAQRVGEPFDRRGEAIFYIGTDGRLIETNGAAARELGRSVNVVDRRVRTISPAGQPALDRALAKALADARPGLVTLQGPIGRPVLALVLPVVGDARDVFYATSAVVVLIDPARRPATDAAFDLLSEAASLTPRELDVVQTVGAGRSPREAAAALGIGYGTLRNHLKAGFAKLGVHTQSELVALVQRLR